MQVSKQINLHTHVSITVEIEKLPVSGVFTFYSRIHIVECIAGSSCCCN